MRRLPTLLLLASAWWATGGCADGSREGGALRLEVAVSPTPAAVGSAQVRVRVRDSLDAPVSGARVVVVGTPPGSEPVTGGDAARGPAASEPGGPGMVTETAREVRPGLWVSDSFPLTLPGEWRLEARADTDDGRWGRRSHGIRVVAPVPGAGEPAGEGE